ncbi:MAG: mercury resistance system periplasmic binding protein MerP [Gemmatimonadaceae bacterium]|nr:mercury resistance system periplasmic binding protein MerP [Gemmatimonadaceae bacterium]
MKFLRSAAAFLLVIATAAWVAPKTVTLSVPGMTCATCPITIKKALVKVPGVTHVEVSYEALEAVVTFDDATTSTDALIKATRDAGYPSTVKLPKKGERGSL